MNNPEAKNGTSAHADSHQSEGANWNAGTILIGLSDPEVRALVTQALEELDRDLAPVADGFHLTERIADSILDDHIGPRPSLIVADALLPGCTGLSLASGLRELNWSLPIVLLVDNVDESTLRHAWMCGASAVLLTPIDRGELVAICRLLLETHESHRDSRRNGRAERTMAEAGARGLGRASIALKGPVPGNSRLCARRES